MGVPRSVGGGDVLRVGAVVGWSTGGGQGGVGGAPVSHNRFRGDPW